MIKEEYVSWDSAKLLKEAGYPQTADYINVPAKYLANPIRPTQAQAMRWLRDEKKIFLEISYDNGFGRPPYYVEIKILPECDYIDDISYHMAHTTYEAAAEAGIQAACKYLIDK